MNDKSLIATAIALLEANEPDDAKVNEAFALACGWEIPPAYRPWHHTAHWDVSGYRPGVENGLEPLPNFCTSLDAVLEEMPERWTYGITVNTETATAYARNSVAITTYGKSDTPHRALMLAILRAKEAS